MLGIGSIFGLTRTESKEYRERKKRELNAHIDERLKHLESWPPKAWKPRLNIDASTYKLYDLFPGLERLAPMKHIANAEKAQYAASPSGNFRYAVRTLPARERLSCAMNTRIGSVLFNAPVGIPCLWEKSERNYPIDGGIDGWATNPWMSLTPQELLTLRPGTRKAKGHVVIAGLGLGAQLIDVLNRPKVERVTLVEISKELVKWILPLVLKQVPKVNRSKLKRVIVGNAFEEMPTLKADVALVDIFPNYGGNDWQTEKIRGACKDIKVVWGWGACNLDRGYSYPDPWFQEGRYSFGF